MLSCYRVISCFWFSFVCQQGNGEIASESRRHGDSYCGAQHPEQTFSDPSIREFLIWWLGTRCPGLLTSRSCRPRNVKGPRTEFFRAVNKGILIGRLSTRRSGVLTPLAREPRDVKTPDQISSDPPSREFLLWKLSTRRPGVLTSLTRRLRDVKTPDQSPSDPSIRVFLL